MSIPRTTKHAAACKLAASITILESAISDLREHGLPSLAEDVDGHRAAIQRICDLIGPP